VPDWCNKALCDYGRVKPNEVLAVSEGECDKWACCKIVCGPREKTGRKPLYMVTVGKTQKGFSCRGIFLHNSSVSFLKAANARTCK
jgi:hypothetical protein